MENKIQFKFKKENVRRNPSLVSQTPLGMYDESMGVYTSRGLVGLKFLSVGDEVVVHDRSFGVVDEIKHDTGDIEGVCVNGVIRCVTGSRLFVLQATAVKEFVKTKDVLLCSWVEAEKSLGMYLVDHVGRRVGKVFDVSPCSLKSVYGVHVKGYGSFNVFGFIVG